MKQGGTTGEVSRARRHIIERPRLSRLLDLSPARVILLLAPAGYGKSTLARQWLSSKGRRATWLQLDRSAADFAALAEGIASAAESFAPGAGEAMRERAKFAAGSRDDASLLADLLAQEITEWPSDAWIAVDDYHLAMDSESSEDFIERLIASTNLSLLVTTRRRPRWATPRRVLYGDIFEIGQSLLAMDAEEAAEVLSRGDLEPLPGLAALADGWPAVIGLAAMTRPIDLPTEQLTEQLYEFLAEELYRGLSENTRRGLALLAPVPRISESSAYALLQKTAPAVLAEGEAVGVLVSVGEFFEMHPLWRDFLARRGAEMRATPSKQATARLVKLLMKDRDWDGAFSVAARGGSSRDLQTVVENEIDNLLDAGRLATLDEHVKKSRGLVDPGLLDLVDAELDFRRGNNRAALVLARRASSLLPSGHTLISRALYRAAQAAYFADESLEAIELAEKAESTAKTAADAANAAWIHYLAALELEHDDAHGLGERVRKLLSNDPDDVLRAASTVLIMDARLGSVDTALRVGEDALCLVNQAQNALVRTSFLSMLGRALVFRTRYDEAIDVFTRGIDDAARVRLDFALLHLHLGLALASLGKGDSLSAVHRLDQAAQYLSDPHTRGNWNLVPAKVVLAQRRYDTAATILAERADVRDSATLAELLAYNALAAACAGHDDDAHMLAASALRTSRTFEPSIVAQLASAIVSEGGLDEQAASQILALAEADAHPDHLVLLFRACPPLLRVVGRLASTGPVTTTALAVVEPHRSGLETLTPREREILELIAVGLRNRDIARKLYISEVTVKVHVRHILAKLGVKTRTEAAVRAAGDAKL